MQALWAEKTSKNSKNLKPLTGSVYHMKTSFPKRYKSILIVFMKMTFFYLDPYILLMVCWLSLNMLNNDC